MATPLTPSWYKGTVIPRIKFAFSLPHPLSFFLCLLDIIATWWYRAQQPVLCSCLSTAGRRMPGGQSVHRVLSEDAQPHAASWAIFPGPGAEQQTPFLCPVSRPIWPIPEQLPFALEWHNYPVQALNTTEKNRSLGPGWFHKSRFFYSFLSSLPLAFGIFPHFLGHETRKHDFKNEFIFCGWSPCGKG